MSQKLNSFISSTQGLAFPAHVNVNNALFQLSSKLSVPRNWIPLVFAMVGTFSLLLLMVLLIKTDFKAPITVKKIPEVIHVKQDVTENPTAFTPQRPTPTTDPVMPKPATGPNKMEVTTAGVEPPIVKKTTGSAAVASGMPIVAPQPKYPTTAARRGIEGWVVVEYYVDQYGRTVQATVLERYPNEVFDRSALNAIAGYRYQPLLMQKNAQATPLRGPFKQKLVFNMEK